MTMREFLSSTPIFPPLLLATALLNFVFGFLVFKSLNYLRLGKIRDQGDRILQEAQERSAQLKAEFQQESLRVEQEKRREWDRLAAGEVRKQRREEDRLKMLGQQMEVQRLDFERKDQSFKEREEELALRRQAIKKEREAVEMRRLELMEKFEGIASLSKQEASQELRDLAQVQVQGEIDQLVYKYHLQAEADAQLHAVKVISTAIDRMAVSQSSPMTAYSVQLPNDDIKGRIIGRDGRNIKYLEHASGVSFTLDDNNSISVSSFDHVRRYIAKLMLEKLIVDGRIHPGKIDEAHETARIEVAKQVQEAGQDAVVKANAGYFHPHIVELLGKMKFRTSVGQNLLEHSLEVSALMGLMASELHLNALMARRIGLLHDIGKVVSHEVEGSHALVGRDLALKFGESKQVANGIACHHQECPAESIEGSLCKPADAISAARVGARQGKMEDYVKRLQQLEALALSYTGIDKAYALQAGREIRIFVKPEEITDQGALQLSRQLAQKIHTQLQFPGKIQVTVIRESRYVDFAL